jgi:spermidine synthase
LFSGNKWFIAPGIIILILSFIDWQGIYDADSYLVDRDTKYGRVLIYDAPDHWTGKETRYMQINKNRSSGMILENEKPSFRYADFYLSADEFVPGFSRALMLGGAAYTFPMYYLKTFPEATIDVVEIDPELTDLARQYFNLEDNKRLRIFHEDGRIFINETNNKYDIFYGDAYNSLYTVPWHLTTVEAAQKIYDLLNPGGVAFLNIISSISGPKSEFLRAELRTFKEVFDNVRAYAIWYPEDEELLQSIVIVASKGETGIMKEGKGHTGTSSWQLNDITSRLVLDLPVLTDQHAPVSYYTNKAID